ncbi:MAG: hypothetical protein ACRD4S_15375 [Candidatus Acidiferrales bacterium]
MANKLARQWRRAPEMLRWRGPFRFLVLVVREILRPFVYWHIWHIVQTDLRQPLPGPYGREKIDVRIYTGQEDLEKAREALRSASELPPVEIDSRFGRGDVVAVANSDNEAAGSTWMTFCSGLELAFGTTWIIHSDEAVQYDSFVRPEWRGRGIHSSLNVALNAYAREHGKVRSLGSISILNSQSLSLARRLRKAKAMTVILVRVRGLNWTYGRAFGAPLDSRFSRPS